MDNDPIELLGALGTTLPGNVRKVIEAAAANGWQANGQGFTFCMRLDKPQDELAFPVYVTWQVGTTPKGATSFRFWNSGTATLQKLSASDLLAYLADPTLIWPAEEGQESEESAAS